MADTVINKVKKLFVLNDDIDDENLEEGVQEEKIEIKYRGINSFKQVKEVCDCLRKKYPVIINLQSATPEVVGRVTDYLSGVLDAVDGEIVAIGVNMWVCTPRDIIVEGKYVELMQNEAEDKNSSRRHNQRGAQDETYIAAPISPYNTKK